MATMAKLQRDARKLGIPSRRIREAETAAELQVMIDDFENGTRPRKAVKKAVKKAVTKPTRRSGRRRATSRASKQAPAVKSRGKAKRSASPAQAPKHGAGRHGLPASLNFNKTDGWHPREGSPVDEIFLALKEFKGDRDKTFEDLKSDVDFFAPKVKRNGERRTKQEQLEMLRYRISRVLWDFAMKTGQHKKSALFGSMNGQKEEPKPRKKSASKAEPKRRRRGRAATAEKAPAKRRQRASKPSQMTTRRRRRTKTRR